MSRGTPHRTIRIEDALWNRALARAVERGENVSDAIRRALEIYADDDHPKITDPYTTAGMAHIQNCPQCLETFR